MSKSIYVVFRLDTNLSDDIDNHDDVIQNILSEMDYTISYSDNNGVRILDTELCGISE